MMTAFELSNRKIGLWWVLVLLVLFSFQGNLVGGGADGGRGDGTKK